jgi:mRNA interferase RelE/StbE
MSEFAKQSESGLTGSRRNRKSRVKPLGRELRGMYSVRAVGQRYRVIYRIDSGVLVVLVVGVGIRRVGDKKDAYSKISKRKDA